MRCVWLGALGVLAGLDGRVHAVRVRTESTWHAIAWSVTGTVAFIAVLIRAELLIRRLDRRTNSDASET